MKKPDGNWRFGWKICSGIFLLAAFLGAWAFWWEPDSLTIHEVTLEIPHWNEGLKGLKVAVIADLHVGSPFIDMKKLQKVVEKTNEGHPDLVLLLGDLVITGVPGGHFIPSEPIATELGKLHAPLGIVSILGNHDWWYDGGKVRQALERQGIRVLENSVLAVDFKGERFWLAGLADLWTRHPDVNVTLAQVKDQNPVLLLTHNPDVFVNVPERVSLTLAGHTHGGQVCLPFIGRPVVPSNYGQRFAYGHIMEGGRHLFVTSGVGTSVFPVRFRVPPEVVFLTLKSMALMASEPDHR